MDSIPTMMKTSRFLTLFSAAFLVSSVAFAQYATDFEAPTFTSGVTINGQDSWTTSPAANGLVLTSTQIAAELTALGITPSVTAHSGSQAVAISGTGSGGATLRVITNLQSEAEVVLNVWVCPLAYTNPVSNPTGNVFIAMENSAGTRAAAFRLGPLQSIDYGIVSGNWVATGKRWNPNTWYRMTLRVDYTSKTYDFAVDGVQINTSPIPFYSASSDSFAQVRIYRGLNQAGLIMDDLSVAAAGPKHEIFWSESGTWDAPKLGFVYSAAFDGTAKTAIATNITRPIGIVLDVKNGYIYWAQDGYDSANTSRIVRANFDGSNPTNLFTYEKNGFANAQMLGLDLPNGQIYWTDFSLGVIRGNLDGTGYTVLGGSGNPTNRYTGLALDLVRRQVYFAEPEGPGMLWRMDMDGKNLVLIDPEIGVDGDDWAVNSMTLDTDNRYLYYPHAMPGADQIIRMNLDDSSKTVLVADTGREPLGIALGPNDTMYWICGGGQSVGTANRDGTLNINQLIAPLDTATGFGIATVCVPPKREIFWSETGTWDAPQLGVIYSAGFDGSDKTVVATNITRPIGIALDVKSNYVYWAQDGYDSANASRIVRANIGGSNPTNLFTYEKNGFSNAQMLGLDLPNGQIYWTDFSLGVIRGNLDGTGYTVLGGSGNSTNRYTALGLDLVHRHIFFSEPEGPGILWRMDMDGKNLVVIDPKIGVDGDDWAVNSLTVDAQNGYIYYPHGMTGADQILRMNLDGSNKTILVADTGRDPVGIALGPNNTMYWICDIGQSVGTAKTDGTYNFDQLFAPLDTATGFGIAAYVPIVPTPVRISGINVQNSTVNITWQGGTAPYQLQRRGSLTQGSWQNVGTTTSTTQATDTVTSQPMFYRVQSN
jgi:hypothetical protein